MATMIIANWIVAHGNPSSLLIKNGPQFVTMLFAKFCLYRRVEQFTTIAFHLKINVQVERYNQTLVRWCTIIFPSIKPTETNMSYD